MSQITFLFVTKRLAIGNEKLEVARVRLVDVWVVNFVDDAVTKREPETATGVIRSADAFFRTGSPARLDPWSAKCGAMIAVRHLKIIVLPDPGRGNRAFLTAAHRLD